MVKTVSFYLERFQRYGVLKSVQLFGPPCINSFYVTVKTARNKKVLSHLYRNY